MTDTDDCDCYPGGFNPATYEGPQEWCPVHGRSRAEFIALLDAARAEVTALRATIARVEALCASGVFDVRAWGDRGTPFSNGADQAFRRVRALADPTKGRARDA